MTSGAFSPSPLQGLDEAFVSPVAAALGEGDLAEDDLLDPSDPTDRQQIQWRQSRAGAANGAAAEHGAVHQHQQQHEAAVDGTPQGVSPAVTQAGASPPASTVAPGDAPYAASAASDVTSATAALALSEHRGGHGSEGGGRQLSMAAQLQKDAFLVFRALCKLSIRSTEAAPGSEITTVRGKVGGGLPWGA